MMHLTLNNYMDAIEKLMAQSSEVIDIIKLQPLYDSIRRFLLDNKLMSTLDSLSDYWWAKINKRIL